MKNKSKLTGVILCAGKGTRIKKLPFKKPKTLLEVFGEPIIVNQLRHMNKIGIRDVFIVVGKRGEETKKKIKEYDNFEMNIKFVKDHNPKGIGHSLYKLRNKVSSPMLVFLGDIFFINLSMKQMIKNFFEKKCSCIIGCIMDNNINNIKKNFTVELKKNMDVKRVVEKPKNPMTNLKGIGVYLFNKKIFSAINLHSKKNKSSDIGITEPIQILIDAKKKVHYSLCAKKDININEPKDLFDINMQLLKIKKKKNFISKSVSLGKNTKIINSIIGENVKIPNNQVIKNSVIFSNVKIAMDKILKSNIVTTYGKLKIK
jgi:glucose-1-phosphate thymidylyltransferase